MRTGFLELEQELALNLLTHIMLGKAGAHSPCGGKPAPQPVSSLLQGERGALCGQTEALSPRAEGRSGCFPTEAVKHTYLLTTVKAQPPPAATGQPQNSAMQLTCYKEQTKISCTLSANGE